MFSPDQVPTHIEKILYSSMRGHETLRLPGRLEPPHPPLSHSGRLMRLFYSVISITFCDMNRLRDKLSVGDPIAAQFVRHDLPRFTTMDSR